MPSLIYKVIIHSPALLVYRQSLYEVEQYVDGISRRLASGPWRVLPTSGGWIIERIDMKMVGHVQALSDEVAQL